MLRIGHRGAAGHAPENTLLSIQKAIELGVDMVEVDVRRTRDGELVLLHDQRVNRTTNGRGRIGDLSFEEVRRLDAGLGEAIPSLREALDLVRGSVQLMIELKEPGIVPEVMDLIEDCHSSQEVILASFHHLALIEVRRLQSTARTLALIDRVPASLDFAKDAEVTHAGVSVGSVTEKFVSSVHRANYQLFVYTVNEERDIRRMSELSVDGIISDYPDRISAHNIL
jgi:glycerophosphoryl diester phosphodiesterase